VEEGREVEGVAGILGAGLGLAGWGRDLGGLEEGREGRGEETALRLEEVVREEGEEECSLLGSTTTSSFLGSTTTSSFRGSTTSLLTMGSSSTSKSGFLSPRDLPARRGREGRGEGGARAADLGRGARWVGAERGVR